MTEQMIQQMVTAQLRSFLADEAVKELFSSVEEEILPLPSLVSGTYDLKDEWTLRCMGDFVSCFGSYVASDEACQGCDLSSVCSLDKQESLSEKREMKAILTSIENSTGFKRETFKEFASRLKGLNLQSAETRSLFSDTICSLSREPLLAGSEATLVLGAGLVKPEIVQYLLLKGW